MPAATNGTITLPIAASATEASFTVTPVDNDAFGDNVVVVFTLGNPTGTLILGTDVEHTFTINNDEIPAITAFADASSETTEIAADATTINISLSLAVIAGGTIDVTFDAANAAAFTSVPAATNGTITLPIAAGATEASFTVTPVDNDAFGDNAVVVFTLGNPTEALSLGTNVNHTFTINNDEIAWTSFEEAKYG